VTAVSRDAVAIDLGQSKLRAARVADDLTVTEGQTVPTPRASREEVLAFLVERIEAVWSDRTVALAVACATTVDHRTGTLMWAGSLPLDDFPLRTFLEERFSVPVTVENDANAAAVGEHRAGAAVGVANLVLLTIGTGVGGGLILNGALHRGAYGAAGEVGHFTVDSQGPRCLPGCLGVGHLDVIGSGSALDAAARASADRHPGSGLGRRGAAGERVDGPAAVELAREGDAWARAAIARVGRRLGRGGVTLVNILDPELVLLGGGAAAAGDLLLDPLTRVVRRCALAPGRDRVRIEVGQLGADAGLVGAAALALEAAR
jgi:glucokinase